MSGWMGGVDTEIVGWITPYKVILALLGRAVWKEEGRVDADVYLFIAGRVLQGVRESDAGLGGREGGEGEGGRRGVEKEGYEPTLREIIRGLREECSNSPNVVNSFLSQLKETNLSFVDALMDLMDSLAPLTARKKETEKPQVDPESIFGVFLRRLLLAYHSLSFCELSSLSDSLSHYLRDSLLTSSSPSPFYNQPIVSSSDAEEFLRRKVSLLLRSPGLVPRRVMRRWLRDFTSYDSPIASLIQHTGVPQYLRSVISINEKDPLAAIEGAHAYYDLNIEGDSSLRSDSTPKPNRLPAAIYDISRIHFLFGHTSLALQSLAESLRVAQQRRDTVTLAHCLSLLLHMDWAHLFAPEGDCERHLLNRSVVFAREEKFPELAIRNALAAAKFAMSEFRCDPSPAVTLPFPLHCLPNVWRWIDHSLSLSWETALSPLAVDAHSSASFCWQVCGNTSLSLLSSHLALSHPALSFTSGRICVTLESLARYAVERGDTETYMKLSRTIRSLLPDIHSDDNKLNSLIWALEHDVAEQRGDVSGAISSYLKGQGSLALCQNNHILSSDVTSFCIGTAKILSHNGDFTSARNLIHFLLGETDAHPALPFQISHIDRVGPHASCLLLLSLAELSLSSSAPSLALSPLLSLLSIARRHPSHYVTLSASLLLCRVFIHYRDVSRASALFHSLSLAAVAQMPFSIQGEYHFVRAKIEMAVCNGSYIRSNSANLTSQSSKLSVSKYDVACVSLVTAISFFEKVRNLQKLVEAYHLLSVAYHSMGNRHLRNASARLFRVTFAELNDRSFSQF